MSRVEVIGLGTMGWPMAQRLVRAGHHVRGIDARPDVQRRWEDEHGDFDGAAQAILCCVTHEAASRQVFASVFRRAAAATLLVDHTTTSDAWAREADGRARAAGLRWCDAPLSGGAEGAASGELVAMVGAREEDLPAIRALLAATTREVVYLGPAGTGQLCKMANQLAIAGIAAGLAQVQEFSRACGLDVARVHHVLLQGSARSVQLERLHATLATQDAPEVFRWLRKDLVLCQEASATRLPVAQLWNQLWETAR